MTHEDIRRKFMIEYDKAQMTTSYPSLTEYEIATVLDKAYLALIAQKFTGNNPRGVEFEGDTKAIFDIQELVTTPDPIPYIGKGVINEYIYNIPTDCLYYVSSLLTVKSSNSSIDTDSNVHHVDSPVVLIGHYNADKFKATDYNLPWLKNPVAYIQNDSIHVLIDSYKALKEDPNLNLQITYIKEPVKFVGNNWEETDFELNDSMAEELINLAIILSAEIVESPRQQTKTTFRPLES